MLVQNKKKFMFGRAAKYQLFAGKRCLAFFLSIMLLMSIFQAVPVKAAGIKLYYFDTKKTVTYTGTKASYEYNGSKVSLGNLTGILTDNGVALGPYYELFVRGLGISYKKDSVKNTLTFSKDGNVLVLTVNSKKAVLNGKEVTMNAAPISVRFVDAGISRIMVPTRFVAESLGYHYRWESSLSTAIIRDKLSLSYNNKQVSYIGTTGKVNFDGRDISLSGLPSILINNTAMLRAETVFKKAMGVKYSYDKKSGRITFKIGDIVLDMQENSTAAYRNGEYLDCGVAPILVTNQSGGTTELMVPGRFVAEKLGFDYNWNSDTKTSEILTTDKVGVFPKAPVPSQTDPSESQTVTDEVEYSFVVDAERYLEFENMFDYARTGIARSWTGDTAFFSRLVQNPDELYCEQYILEFDRPVGSIQSALTTKQLTVTVGEAYAAPKEYNNPSGSLVTRISQGQDSFGGGAVFTFGLSDDLPYYDLELSNDGKKLSVTIFPNYLVGLEVGRNQTGKYMRFKGIQAFQYTLGDEGNYQAVYFHNTCNTAGNLVFPDELFGSYFEHAYMVETDPNQIKLLYRTTEDTELKFVQESNTLYIYFEMNEQDKPTDTTDDTRPVQKGIYGELPKGVKFSDLTVEDQYWNRKIIITVPGNHSEFFQSEAIRNPYSVVGDISVQSDGAVTKIILTTSRIQGYKLKAEGSGFSLLLGNPSEIYDKIVVLDAGHGGIDPGASAGGYNEKDINFTILNNYTKDYFEGSDIKIYFTRTEDVKIDLYERADFASRVEADIFVSLHINSVSSTSVNGTSVYYSLLNNSVTSGGLTGKQMAETLTNNLSNALGTKNRGVATADFVVIRETRMPAVLIELAFITNASDRKIITTPATQKKAAKTIYDTIVKFFKDYPTGR